MWNCYAAINPCILNFKSKLNIYINIMSSKRTNNIIKLSYLSGIDIITFAILGKLKLNRQKYFDLIQIYFINNEEKVLIENDLDIIKCVYLYNMIINKRGDNHELPIIVKIDNVEHNFTIIFKNKLKKI